VVACCQDAAGTLVEYDDGEVAGEVTRTQAAAA
jgi:hypothetical protein